MEELEVFADIACPFTHVGLHRFAALRASLGRDRPLLRVRAWPLELVNGEPLRGDEVAPKVAALRRSVAPDGFAGFDAALFPTSTRPALASVAAAYRMSAPTMASDSALQYETPYSSRGGTSGLPRCSPNSAPRTALAIRFQPTTPPLTPTSRKPPHVESSGRPTSSPWAATSSAPPSTSRRSTASSPSRSTAMASNGSSLQRSRDAVVFRRPALMFANVRAAGGNRASDQGTRRGFPPSTSRTPSSSTFAPARPGP
jgi:hypothetical protein